MPLGLGALLVLTIDLLTEQGPANSLAFEPPENKLMERPPRDIKTQRLVSFALISYAYLIIGSAESIVCIGAYLWTFKKNGVPASEIFLLNPEDNTWMIHPDDVKQDVTIDGKVFSAEMQSDIVRQV